MEKDHNNVRTAFYINVATSQPNVYELIRARSGTPFVTKSAGNLGICLNLILIPILPELFFT